MQKISRCTKCDGDVIWMQFKNTLCCTWCGLHYTLEGTENPTETPTPETVVETPVKHGKKEKALS